METRDSFLSGADPQLAFKNLEGERIEDPHPKIRKLNLFKAARDYAYQIDYKTTYHQEMGEQTLTIGVAEQCGARPRQEDRLAVGSINLFPLLTSAAQRQDVLKNTCDFFQALVKQKKIGIVVGKKTRHSGSTLISVVTVGQQLTLANLGDSVAYLLLLPQQRESTIQQLNTFHNPSRIRERARLKFEGYPIYGPQLDRIYKGRLNGVLAVSRAVGDNDFLEHGLSHQSEIKTISLNIPPQTKAFIIVACDGLKDNLDEVEIKKLVRTHRQQPLEDIAQALTQAACKKGKTGDNVSVVIMPVDRNAPYASLQAVFDGHGGDAVSDVLGQLYTLVLQHQTYLAVWKNLNSQIGEASAQAVQACIMSSGNVETLKKFLRDENNELFRIFQNEFFKNEYLLPAVIAREKALQTLDPAARVAQRQRQEFHKSIDLIEEMIVTDQPTKIIQAFKLMHCPGRKEDFLDIPVKVATEAFEKSLLMTTKMLETGQKVEFIDALKQGTFSYQYGLEDVYCVAGITLAIREKYSKKMIAVDKGKVFKMDSKIERMIDRIEHTVETTFKALQESPDVAIEKQIEDMLTKLKELLPHVEKSSKVFGLFGDTEKVLTSLLAQACVEIEKVHHKLLSPKRRAP